MPEQLLRDITDTVCRSGALLQETISVCIVLGPEHTRLLADQGWDQQQIKDFVYAEATNTREVLDLGRHPAAQYDGVAASLL